MPLTAGAAADRVGRLAKAAAVIQVKWRVLAIIMIPVVDLIHANLYLYMPDTVAGFAYEVRINRITNHTFVVFETQTAPENLKRPRCR